MGKELKGTECLSILSNKTIRLTIMQQSLACSQQDEEDEHRRMTPNKKICGGMADTIYSPPRG